MTSWRRRAATIVLRWFLGVALVSWRYMWQTTPLYRTEHVGELPEEPPPIPPELVDDDLQLDRDGVGSLYHRQFRVDIADARVDAEQLVGAVIRDFERFVPSEVVGIRGSRSDLRVGDEFVVEMPGPWNGPVRVVHADGTCLRLATLCGHLEAGQIQFRARPCGELLQFRIDAWARPSTRLVNLLYAHLRLAKEIQLNMWVRFCRAAADAAGGRPADGIHIRTHAIPAATGP
ncbi:hypothetical protein GCM10011581_40080 [Saccharopolyspora subtropica]|uniref:DUF1990 domain-containing protein n=1 Tax=Saccharopolyspora thermophila TaxID=89367 RepID=A0A917K4N0_9PSEU|nr:DUF1990 family protein [Saccharopolyspora subtropica]GGI98833.1 hypothetical protein GCM10011581_40080 [Saccharopolyspora subtropica]